MTIHNFDDPLETNLWLAEEYYALASYYAEEPPSEFTRREFIKCKIQAYLYLNKAKEYSNESNTIC